MKFFSIVSSCLFFPFICLFAQHNDIDVLLSPEVCIQELQHVYFSGLENKSGIQGIMLPLYQALTAYPSLQHTTIVLKSKKIRTTMAARPAFSNIIKSRSNRVYNIYINSRYQEGKAPLYHHMPFNVRVGIFGHELAHILDYESKNKLELVAFGFSYVFSKPFRKKTEKRTDMITINHGLGWQLEHSKTFIWKTAPIDEEYRKFKQQFYLNEKEILEFIEQLCPPNEWSRMYY